MQPAKRESVRTWIKVIAIVLLLGGSLALRVIDLDADPPGMISRDFITDEGQWAHNARNALIFGQWETDEYNPGLYSAYLYNTLLYLTMKVFGPNFSALRLVSAIAGWLTVVLLLLLVWRERSAWEAIVAAALLGFCNLHVMYSRTAFAESSMTFFLVLALLLWSLRTRHALFALTAGAAFALMCLTKVTAVYLFPAVLLLRVAEGVRGLKRRDAWLFFGGALAVAGAFVELFLRRHFADWVRFNVSSGLYNEWPARLADLVYSIQKLLGSRFFAKTPILAALTLLGFAGLIVSVSKHGVRKAIRDASDTEIIGWSLLVGYSCSLAFTVYQAERRFIPALVPMAMLSARALDKGWGWLRGLINGENKVGAGAWFVLLIPLIVLSQGVLLGLAMVIAGLKWNTLNSPSHIWFWLLKVVPILALALFLAAANRSGWGHRYKRRLVRASAVAFAMMFFFLCVGLLFSTISLCWPGSGTLKLYLHESRTSLVLTVALVMSCAAVVFSALRTRTRPAVLIVAFFFLLEGVQISAWLLQPTYTLKEAAAELARIIRGGSTVVTHYETCLVSSNSRVVCYWPTAHFNTDAFERFNPEYVMILRRDNWRDLSLDELSIDKWPPPTASLPAPVVRFELCPVPSRGPRFVVELYRFEQENLSRNASVTQQ